MGILLMKQKIKILKPEYIFIYISSYIKGFNPNKKKKKFTICFHFYFLSSQLEPMRRPNTFILR